MGRGFGSEYGGSERTIMMSVVVKIAPGMNIFFSSFDRPHANK